MESTRLSKIERLLQKELSDIFQKQTQAMHGILISVSVVRVSPDLSVARAYLSIFPSDKSKEMLENIRANTKAIRFDLGQRIRKQVRKIPELTFFIDDSLDYIENVEKVKEYRVELPVLYSPALPFLEEIPQCHQYYFDGICLWGGGRYNGLGVCAVCIERVCRAGFFDARQFRSGAEDSACTWKGVRSDSSGCPGSEGVA